MKNIRIFILFLTFFGYFSFNFSLSYAIDTSSNSNTLINPITEANKLLEKDTKTESDIKKDNLNNQINTIEINSKENEIINNISKEALEKLVNELKNKNKDLEKNIELLNTNNKDLNNRLSNLNDNLENNIEIKAQIKENYNKILEKEKELTSFKKQIAYYQEELLKSEFNDKKNELILNDLKKQLNVNQKDLDDIYSNKITILLYNLFGLFIILFLLFLTNYFYNKYKEHDLEIYKNNNKVLLMLGLFLFIIFSVTGYFYLYPKYIVYLLLGISALVLIFKTMILSFFYSIGIMFHYKIGDIINIDGYKGVIKNIGLLSVNLIGLDEKNTYNNFNIKIPNFKMFEEKIKKENGDILIDKIVFNLSFLDISNYDKLKTGVRKILNKNISHPLKSYDLKDKKYKEIIKMNNNEIIVTYFWNETIERNFFIKEKIIKFILDNNIVLKSTNTPIIE